MLLEAALTKPSTSDIYTEHFARFVETFSDPRYRLGLADVQRITRPRWRQLHDGIIYCQATIDHVDVENDRVYLGNGNTLDYDVLIVATGAAWSSWKTGA